METFSAGSSTLFFRLRESRLAHPRLPAVFQTFVWVGSVGSKRCCGEKDVTSRIMICIHRSWKYRSECFIFLLEFSLVFFL